MSMPDRSGHGPYPPWSDPFPSVRTPSEDVESRGSTLAGALVAPQPRCDPAQPPPTPSDQIKPASPIRPDIRQVPDKHVVQTEATNADADAKSDDEAPNLAHVVLRSAPPWLVSLIFHMLLLIVLGLLFMTSTDQGPLDLVVFADKLGDLLVDDSIDLLTQDVAQDPEVIFTLKELPPVDEPFAAPPKLNIAFNANRSTRDIDAPVIGLALKGRQTGMKEVLLEAYGGDEVTERAVKLGLEWLKRNQHRNGSWSLRGPYGFGSSVECKPAATAMALMAFLGSGNTHTTGKYKDVVAKGSRVLVGMQDSDGNFVHPRVRQNMRLYSQAQATIAICELYGMTKASQFREPAQRSINYAVKIQASQGGWRYNPGRESDTSVTGWFVMALQSARMAGLEVPSTTLMNVSKFLDSVAVEGGSRYAYLPGSHVNSAMSAEGLLCRQYLGWLQNDPRLIRGVQMLNADPIDWNQQNVYYWYYATQVTHHMEGDEWDRWNNVMKRVIPRHQVKTGKERGSWSPANDEWGVRGGGRLFTTCLCIYMLEVYYRHMPIYADLYKQ